MLQMIPLTLLLVTSALATEVDLLDLDTVGEHQRLLKEITTGTEDKTGKAITYKSAGDYTLVSIPWNGATTLNFNDTAAATLSTIGNAALLVGGLYLLSGFPTAIARSDPFGISKRFGKPAPPPKFYQPEQTEVRQKKKKVAKTRKPRPQPFERRGPGFRYQPEAEERQLPQQMSESMFKRPSSPQPKAEERQLPVRPFGNLRPLQFRMPQLPRFRLPQLPSLRRPAPRPSPSRPQSAPAPAAPVFRPQSAQTPAPATRRPSTRAPAPVAPVRPQSAPVRPQSAPVRPQPSVRPSAPVIPPVAPVQSVQSQSSPQTLPDPRPAAPSDFGSAFSSDPFSEFQNSDFGSEQSFQDLIAAQFGDSFDLKRLPN